MQTSTPKVPGIFTDIDGVLINLHHAIPEGAEAIKFVKTPLKDIDRERFSDIEGHLPFCCLTNSGVGTEHCKAEKISNMLGLENHERLTKQQVIMNYTPLRPILEKYQDKMVLVGGGPLENLTLLAEDFGLTKYIADEEFCIIFPQMVPYKTPASAEVVQQMKEKIAKRLRLENISELDEPFQVHAIFMINDPIDWGDRIQIICDFLSTHDGKIAKEMPIIGPEEHIPVYCTNNDLLFRGHFQLPRMTFGCFNQSLKEVYKSIYKRDLHLNIYGKPFELTFKYAEKHLRAMTNLEISNFYMIGDNPKSDIRGGNSAGWTTILVKTGLFKQTEVHLNDHEDPAKYVVENIYEAIKLICELEGIKFDI